MRVTKNGRVDSKKASLRRKKIIERLIFDLIIFAVLIVTGTILLNKSFQFESEQIVKYNEKSDIDYRVYLLKNDFYDQEYLGKDMLYVASLIDKIQLNFDYNFETEDNENVDFEYSIVAKLSISNPAETKSYFDKTYTLLNPKTVHMENASQYNIKEELMLNYPYYNNLASSFRSQYGVEAESKLTVYMLINKKNNTDSSFILDSSSVMNIMIPVSEKAIDIRLDYKAINETSNIIKKRTMSVKDYLPLCLAIIFIILSLVMMVKAMRNCKLLMVKHSKYDKEVARLLKEYDRLIAESSSLMSFDDKEVIGISKFTELLDIHDNLQVPIMYYEVIPHKESYFYISHDNVIYLLDVKDEEE